MASRCQEFIISVMNQMGKNKIFYALTVGEPPPDALYYFRQIPGARRKSNEHVVCEYALFEISPDQAFKMKRIVNCQVG